MDGHFNMNDKNKQHSLNCDSIPCQMVDVAINFDSFGNKFY